MRKIFLPLATAFCFLLTSSISNCQNNMVLGDLSIASFQSQAYPTSTFNTALLELDDSFSP